MSGIKKLTLLHSNDLHGAFFPVEKDGVFTGGISLLAGCLNKIRKQEESVLYAIAGDLLKGSLIDAEFKGISTIEMINLLKPDVATVGNHESDYGLAHLLFLEKCARFPLLSANMNIVDSGKRLFEPFTIIDIGGMKVMFIGLVTKEILLSLKSEELIGNYLNVDDYDRQIATILDSYKTRDVDLTVLMTHIGYEEDRRLAQRLGHDCGIDILIGAHSHTLLSRPKIINDIPIVQVGSGFDHLGRFDIEIDTDDHRILSYDYEVLDIDAKHYEKDALMEEVLAAYSKQVEDQGERILTTFSRRFTHTSRHQESELSDLFADLMQMDSSFDIMMLGTGSFRGKGLGPVVDQRSFKEVYPFDNAIYMLKVKGKTFRKMCHHFLKASIESKGADEFYAFSKGVQVIYDPKTDLLEHCRFLNKEIEDEDLLKIALQEFHLNNCEVFLGVSLAELSALDRPVMVVKNDASTYEEMLLNCFEPEPSDSKRIIIKDR